MSSRLSITSDSNRGGGGNSTVTSPPPAGNYINSNSTATTINCMTTSPISSNNSLLTPTRRLRNRSSVLGYHNNTSNDSQQKKNVNNSANQANDLHTTITNRSTVVIGGNNNSNANANGSISNFNINNNIHTDDKPTASKKYHNSCPHLVSSGRKDSKNHLQPHSSSTFDMHKTEEFHFDTPQECPVFRPTLEEFRNPLAYISKIRPIAEKCGICKILPPVSWSPPFAVDVDKLKFTPRVQRLNELEAKTRIKLNFLDQIAKFWELQGSSLKIPMVERKALDLYTLHRVVQQEGGMDQTTKERKWAKVANRMSYPSSKSVGATLKAHYERILLPFEIYTSGKVLGSTPGTGSPTAEVKLEDGTDYKTHEIPTRQQITPPKENNARRSKRFANSNTGCVLGTNKQAIKSESKEDFKRDLMNSFNASLIATNGRNSNNNSISKKTPEPQMIDPLMKYICHICNRGDVEESMLLCDGCDDSYHTFCLLPPLTSIPKGEWMCPRCVVEEVSKPTEAFGFEQAEREYTLQQFGQMADQFKMDYFRKPVHLVPTDLVEREFWRIVSSIDEDVTVEYGADLHTMDHGSGFPTRSSLYLLPGDQEYAESSWNLNNLPLLEDSILGHINADISGMNAPWMYVGMCFAAFCWHNEDHWSYSINYLHWGEPKTWYGVPGGCAEQLEETMKKVAPELFASQPDLLHQLVTIMNPNILMNNGVPVCRTDQNAGEFVITFPRAYHAGFNQGYNFAEAVNFAPADWLKMGRECINHYSTLRRFCVFSHDELVCKMALEPAKLTFGIATACYIDMVEMVDSEKKLRKSLLEWGVTRAERKAFELVPDDERHCQECNTTCFLSAVSCDCTKAIVCLRHYTVLCHCSPDKHTLLYRYTLDEMPLMLQKLKAKAQSFERWLSRCRDIVDANTPTSVTLQELQELCKEAETKKFPSSLLIDRLNAAVLEAEKCVTVIQQLGINKVRTRSDNNADAAQYKLTMEELGLFVQEIDNLCCIIDEGASVRELLTLGKQFVEKANDMLKRPLDNLDELELESVINDGNSLRIELDQIYHLNQRHRQLKWYKRSQSLRNANTKISYEDIKNLLFIAAGDVPPLDPIINREIKKLQEIGAAIEAWEHQVTKYLNTVIQRSELITIEELLKSATKIDGQLPSYSILKDALRKAKDWLKTVEELPTGENFPYSHILEAIVEHGNSIPIKLEELSRMQDHLKGAQEWRDNAECAFLKENTFCSLIEVLMPRQEPFIVDTITKKSYPDAYVKSLLPPQIVEAFKLAEAKELIDMRNLRRKNLSKIPSSDEYCLCKTNFRGMMYMCQLCLDWFHEDCIIPPPLLCNNDSSDIYDAHKTKWLCPVCVRSKRPRLEIILPLLMSLQTLPICLPEDEALRCLAERAMSWQEKARRIIFPTVDTDSTVSSQCQKESKLEMINSNNVVNGTDGTIGNRKVRRYSQRNSIDANSDKMNESDDDDEGRLHIVEDNLSGTEGAGDNDGGIGDHHDGNRMKFRKVLTENEIQQLNELIMEGDLLEVTLDEKIDLWRFYSDIKPINNTQAILLIEQYQKMQKKQQLQQQQQIQQQQTGVNQTPTSSINSAAEDSNDSLLTQSSVNGNVNGKSTSNNSKKRRSSPSTSAQSRKKSNATMNKQTATVLNTSNTITSNNKKYARKSDTIKLDETGRCTPNKQTNCNRARSVTPNLPKRQRKRLGNNTNANSTTNQRKMSITQQEQLLQQDDDEEECRAENCHKPTGREVDWVQCDGGCNEWFHMYCVGLNRNQIKADDDYICIRCSKAMSAVKTSIICTTSSSSSTTTLRTSNISTPTTPTTTITTMHYTMSATIGETESLLDNMNENINSSKINSRQLSR